MRSMVEERPKAKKEYIDKLNRIRKQKTIHVGSLKDFKKMYGIK